MTDLKFSSFYTELLISAIHTLPVRDVGRKSYKLAR